MITNRSRTETTTRGRLRGKGRGSMGKGVLKEGKRTTLCSSKGGGYVASLLLSSIMGNN